MLRVYMTPELSNFDKYESGIKRVVEAYYRYAPKYGIEYVTKGENYDLAVIHAGMSTAFDNTKPLVSHCHGLYWTADYASDAWELKANRDVIESLRHATLITVPSKWVAKTIQRDMRIDPVVIPHGVEWVEWQHDLEIKNYVLWNKNRNADVCDPTLVGELAKRFKDIVFRVTFKPNADTTNLQEIGLKSHAEMKTLVQQAAVYLSTTKETFSIGVLEAMASGTPVLSVNRGNVPNLVQHGVCGYLYREGDVEDMRKGLEYCLTYRSTLSDNAKELAKQWTWDKAYAMVAETYQKATDIFSDRKRARTI